MEPEPLLPPVQPLQPARPTWRRLVQQHWAQWLVAAALWALMKAVDPIEPRPRAIYHGSDAEYWRYSYPFMEETLPLWAVPVLTLLLPLAIFLSAHLVGWATAEAAHHACLNLLACVFTSGLVANTLKSQVARPRPDFLARCWPRTLSPVWGDDGMPQCEKGVPHAIIKTGMRSFPSVHAAWSGAGLGFLSLWMTGALRCFAGGAARPAQLVAALAPLAAAGWVGITRIANNRHHPSDVLGAYALGLSLALLFYLQVFASPFSARAGQLVQRGSGGRRRAQAADWPAGEPEAEPVAL